MSEGKKFGRSVSSPNSSIDRREYEDSLSLRRRRDFASTKSLSMATIQAQVTIAQSIRDMFTAARTGTTTTDGDSVTENAWLQAVYNCVVLLIFGVIIFVVIAVYFVLEPFLHPLLWAVLIGMFLHPFKRAATERIEKWLTGLERARIPLAVGVFLSPFSFFNHLSSQLDDYLVVYLTPFLILLGTIVALYLAVTFNLLDALHQFIVFVNVALNYVDQAVSVQWFVQVLLFLSVIVIVLSFVVGSLEGPTGVIIKGVVVTLWYLILVLVANYALGYVGLPLITVLFGASLLVWLIRSQADSEVIEEEKNTIGSLVSSLHGQRRSSLFQQINENILEKGLGIVAASTDSEQEEDDDSDGKTLEEEGEKSEAVDVNDLPYHSEKESSEDSLRRRRSVHFSKAATVDDHRVEPEPYHSSYSVDSPFSLSCPESSHGILKKPESDQSVTVTHIFLVLTTTCSLVMLWRNMWLLLLIVPVVLWSFIRKPLIMRLPFVSLVYKKSKGAFDSLLIRKKELLFPQPLPIFLQLCRKLDKKLLRALKSSVGTIMSGGIIIALAIGGVGMFVFFVLEVQVEVAYAVNLMKQVLDSSVIESPWLSSIVPGSNGTNDSMVNLQFEQFADQGFHYGRDWLKGQVEFLLNGSGSDSTAVVDQILELYDSFYHIYVFKNVSATVLVSNITHHHEMEGLREHLLHGVKHIMTDNMETILSVMKTLWSVLSVNLSIVLSIVTSLSHLIFSGGTILLNFVVFITALFYLLAYSKKRYLPVKWIMDILPDFLSQSSQEDYADSFANVIRGVFHASFQRACFYGLYTWLVLSVLGRELTIVPSVLAAVTGAIPFIGPYWLSVPAVLELWLVEGSPLLALLTIVLFLLPPFTVDTIINREIQGGHPYLTGLAIAGGVYFAGLEGAIFGPILLCCLLFLVNFLTSQF